MSMPMSNVNKGGYVPPGYGPTAPGAPPPAGNYVSLDVFVLLFYLKLQ